MLMILSHTAPIHHLHVQRVGKAASAHAVCQSGVTESSLPKTCFVQHVEETYQKISSYATHQEH